MLHAVVLLLLIPTSAYGLHCSQVSVKVMPSAIGILTALNISYSGLNDDDLLELPECFQSASELSSLHVLDLQGNQISGHSLPSLLDRLPNLQYLYLKANPLAELDGTLFRAARQLQFLDISETPLRVIASDLLYPISSTLRSLIMEKTHLEYIPDGFFGRGLQQGRWVLQNLSLSKNLYLSSLPDNIFHQLTSLQWIDVSKTGIECYPSTTPTYLSIFPQSLPECAPLMRRRLLSAPEIFATERAVFRLDLDHSSLIGQRRSNVINSLIIDISISIGVKSSRIVNVQLGPSTLSTTMVQLDIIDDGRPTAREVVSSMMNQSLIESSPFRTGSVTSHIILSSSIVSIPSEVRKCSTALFVDVSESCPPETQSNAFYANSQILIYLIIAMCLVFIITVICVIRSTARHRSAKRLRDAMTDVINLSLELEIEPQYNPTSPTIKPSDYPLQPVTSFSASDSKIDPDQASEFTMKPKLAHLTKPQSTVTLVKRPGLNAIRSKKMLLVLSGDENDSMIDTDAEF